MGVSARDHFSQLFVTLACAFVACLLISNIIAGKLIEVFGFVLPAAVILFPVTYIFGDVLTEVYGFERTRLVIWVGFAANALMSAVFLITIALPHPSFWKQQNEYATVLGFTPRVVLASLIAYAVGEFSNSIVMSKLKLVSRGRRLWLRTIGSTLVGQGIDTLIFISIAFAGVAPQRILFEMMAVQFLWKVGYEAAFTPLTYLVVNWAKRREGLDVFDRDVHYNPFRMDLSNGDTRI